MDREALEGEVEEWVSGGIITEAQATEILSRDETEGGRQYSRAVLAISLVGAALVLAGVTLFLATNWTDLSRAAQTAVLVAAPLWVAFDFQRDALVVLKVVFLFEDVADAEFHRARSLVPLERVEVVADEAVQFVSLVAIAPVPRR